MSAQKYIPGLMPRPEDPDRDVVPQVDYDALKQPVPKELLKDFKSGKNAVMCINELSQRLKLELEFEDVGVSGMHMGGFGCVCFLDGVQYEVGVGKTKKDAKTKAAKNAFNGYMKRKPKEKPKAPAGKDIIVCVTDVGLMQDMQLPIS